VDTAPVHADFAHATTRVTVDPSLFETPFRGWVRRRHARHRPTGRANSPRCAPP